MEDMELHPMRRSKALEKVGYDAKTADLVVRFRSGRAYVYHQVDQEVFDGLLTSAHPWTEYHRRVLEHEYDPIEGT